MALSEALLTLDNQLSIETFGVPETSHSKAYSGSLNSLPHNFGANNPANGSLNNLGSLGTSKKQQNPIKSKFYKENVTFFNSGQDRNESEEIKRDQGINESIVAEPAL